jgi:hypothetical protein
VRSLCAVEQTEVWEIGHQCRVHHQLAKTRAPGRLSKLDKTFVSRLAIGVICSLISTMLRSVLRRACGVACASSVASAALLTTSSASPAGSAKKGDTKARSFNDLGIAAEEVRPGNAQGLLPLLLRGRSFDDGVRDLLEIIDCQPCEVSMKEEGPCREKAYVLFAIMRGGWAMGPPAYRSLVDAVGKEWFQCLSAADQRNWNLLAIQSAGGAKQAQEEAKQMEHHLKGLPPPGPAPQK